MVYRPDLPIYGYWQMHEKGPGVTEPITVFEQMGFGIELQKYEGADIVLKLRAFPERLIRVAKDPADQVYKPYIKLQGTDTELASFYVFAEDAFFLPKVKYIEIHGIAGGNAITEKIQKG